VDLRQAGKDRRRKRILDAARRLLIDEGVEALSMRRLAAAAEVSTRTLYNLSGTKDEILVALMGRTLDDLDDQLTQLALEDPILRSRAIVALANQRMVDEARLVKPLLLVTDRTPRDPNLIRRTREFQCQAIGEAMEGGALRPDLPARLLAHQIVTAQMNAARHWAHGRLTDEAFQAQALHVWALLMLAVAHDQSRERFLHELRQLEAPVVSLLDGLEGRAAEAGAPRGQVA